MERKRRLEEPSIGIPQKLKVAASMPGFSLD